VDLLNLAVVLETPFARDDATEFWVTDLPDSEFSSLVLEESNALVFDLLARG